MNKFVLRFSGSATEYAGVLGPDCLPDNHNFVKISDGTRPTTARMFMSDAQYNALPTDFKASSIEGTNGLCAIQITTNAFNKDTPGTSATEQTIQTSYCFFLVSAQPVLSGVDTDIREICLSTTQALWPKSPVFGAWNTRFNTVTGDYTSPTTRTAILAALWDNITSSLRYGIAGSSLPTLPNNSHNNAIFIPPINFVCQCEQADKALRRILDPCGYTLVFNPWVASLADTSSTQLAAYNLGDTDANVAKVEVLTDKARANGCKDGSVDETWGNWNTPGVVRFILQTNATASVETSPGTIISTEDLPNSAGKSWVILPVYVNEYKSGTSYGVWKGQTLKAIAGRTGIKPRRFMLVGAYAFAPGAQLRTVEIYYNKNGAYTVLTQHGYVEPSGKRDYGIVINPDDFNIVSSSGISIDRRSDGTIDISGGSGGSASGQMMLAQPVADFEYGDTGPCEMTPCDINGNSVGLDNVDVVTTDWEDLLLISGTTTTKVSSGMIIPIMLGNDSKWYVVGAPKETIIDIDTYFDGDTKVGVIKANIVLDFGTWYAEPVWVDKINIGECTA